MAAVLKTPRRCIRLLLIIKKEILTPNIYFVRVVRAAKNQFRCSVVSAHYIWSIQSILPHYLSRSKITNLYYSLFIFEDIFWLKVTMTDALTMHKSHSGQNLSHEVLNLFYWDSFVPCLCLLYNVLQILIAILEYYVLYSFSILLLAIIDVNHLNAIFAIAQFF